MKSLYNREEPDKTTVTHKTEIKCLKCGIRGFADEEYCPYCGAKYPLKAVIVDFDMRFSSMVLFMVKWAIASIPAFIILVILLGISAAILSGIGVSLRGR